MPTIFPLTAELARLDIVATAAAGGYDEAFKSVVKAPVGDTGLGSSLRKEKAVVQFLAQEENDLTEMQRMTGDGDLPRTAVGLVVDVHELAALAVPLYNLATGEFGFSNGDRLVRTLNADLSVSMTFDRPEVYLRHNKRLNGFLGSFGNLALLVFDDRPQGAQS